MHNEENCPYCNTSEDCPHLLLLVDVTFRSAEGGILLSEFNEKGKISSTKNVSEKILMRRGSLINCWKS